MRAASFLWWMAGNGVHFIPALEMSPRSATLTESATMKSTVVRSSPRIRSSSHAYRFNRYSGCEGTPYEARTQTNG